MFRLKALITPLVALAAANSLSACASGHDITLRDNASTTVSPKPRPDDKSHMTPGPAGTADPDACATSLDPNGDLATGVAAHYGTLEACGYNDQAKTFVVLATGLTPSNGQYTEQGAIGFYDCPDDGKTNGNSSHPFKCWTWVPGPCPGQLVRVNGLEGVPAGDLAYLSGPHSATTYFDVAARRFTLLAGQSC